MNRLFFFLPILYSFTTRLNSNKKRIAWVLSYYIPVAICVFLIYTKYTYTECLALSVFIIYTIYASYEIGYIYNDTELIKKEKNPTLRLENENLEYYENNKYKIYLTRSIILIVLILVACFIDIKLGFSLTVSCVTILLLYSIYNSIRNRYNIPLYSLLVYTRYFSIFIFSINSFDSLLLWLVYPFCVTLEFMSKPRFKFNMKWILNNLDMFRSIYYSFLLILIIALDSVLMIDKIIYILVLYFLAFRILSFIFLSKKYRSAS
ncbi:hypothetical protein SS08_07630 [Enterobacter hormaechei subsp. steigerwaltii]|nr:hypothetical protein LI62_15845 [Enterobacter hormaechei subsp. steigerwaltii]KJO32266.1 hypothetical protein SS08_07630 [Enterobacter hormaechei subsp. steigerwaltii]